METRRLQYFIEVCKAGSMTRAAARLELSQAALSQQVAILGTEFKTRFFRRLYPQIRLHFLEGMTGELTERILNGQFDLATLLRNEDRAGVLSTPMFKEELFLISPASFGLAEACG
jgi:DNA-binding transcriptional LysR family regulator